MSKGKIFDRLRENSTILTRSQEESTRDRPGPSRKILSNELREVGGY